MVAGARSAGALAGLDGVTAVEVDLAAPGGPEQLVARAVEAHGRVDVLVNNVGGVKLRTEGFLSLGDADFEASLQLNFFSALRATRAAVADMLPRGEGTIVNVASVNAFFHPDGLVIDYGAAKAALAERVEGAVAGARAAGDPHQQRLARARSRPTCGWARTAWRRPSAAATGADADAVRAQAAQGFATRRFTAPEEVATLVALLASPRTANVTGSDYVIDGGLIKTL